MQKYIDKFISELHILLTKGTKYHWSVTVLDPPPQPSNTADISENNIISVFEDDLSFFFLSICEWSHGLPFLSACQGSPTRLVADSEKG